MASLWTRIFLLGSALGVAICLILVSLTVWLENQTAPPLSPINIRLQYQTELKPIVQRIQSLIDGNLLAVNQFELTDLRNKLMRLIVPAEARNFHLQMVLKLQQLENVLVKPTSADQVTAAKIAADIKALIVEHQW
jgi:hypothetical protein